jgi:dienelactone hydrolase
MFARISTEAENRLLVVQKLNGEVIAAGNVGTLKVAGLTWASDDHVIVYTHRTDRPNIDFDNNWEFTQGIVVNVKTRKFAPLVQSTGNYFPALFGYFGFVKEADQWYAYVGLIPLEPGHQQGDGTLKQGYPDLYKVGLDSGTIKRVAFGSSYNRDWVIDEKGQIVAVSEHDRQSGNWKVMLPDSTKTVASGHARYGFSLVGLGRMPGTVLIGQDDGEQTLRELNLSDGSLAELPYTHLIFSRTTRLLAGLVTGSEQWHTTMFDPILARHMQSVEKAFAGASLSFNSISTDQSKMVVYVDGAGTTGTWQLVDFNSKQAVPLADAYSGIPEDAVGSVQVVDYRASDGLAIKGILTLPYGSGTASHLPLVVLPHGGPESIDTVGFDWWAQAFASHGYAVFQPNFRGSAGYGAEFRNAGFGQWGRKMQTDISDGVADLAARGVIDPKRVCIVGASYGGYAALAAVTLQHGIYRCAASYAGVSDPGDMLQYTAKIYGPAEKGSSMRYWRSYFGIGENASHVPDEISPLAHAAEADAPILLIHGMDDTTVPIEQSDRMESALKRAGKPVERVTLRGEDHGLSRSATRLQMLEAMMGFVQSHNPADMLTAH